MPWAVRALAISSSLSVVVWNRMKIDFDGGGCLGNPSASKTLLVESQLQGSLRDVDPILIDEPVT